MVSDRRAASIPHVLADGMVTRFVGAGRQLGGGRLNPRHFTPRNWDRDAPIERMCAAALPLPILQVQAASGPGQPPSMFADVATRRPNVQLVLVSNASHFDNCDRPGQVADVINRFVRRRALQSASDVVAGT